MRDRKSEDFSINLLLTFHELEVLDDGPHCERYTVRILSVGDVESRSATLYFAREKRKVHIVRGHKEGLIAGDEVTDEGCKLLALIFRKCLPFKSDRVVRLRTSSSERDGIVPAFINTFN